MVLLPVDAATSTEHAKLRGSSSLASLPALGPGRTKLVEKASSFSLTASHSQPLGLGPADRSLLPDQQRQRRNKHVSCQTSATELADLRLLQEQLFEVRQELASVNQELSHAERRLRHEVREEMEEKVRKFEKKTMERVAFLRQRQEKSVSVMRKASNAQVESHKSQIEGTLRSEHQRVRAGEERELGNLNHQLEQRDLLIAGYKRENRELRDQIEMLKSRDNPAALKRGPSSDETASLEAALANRDATIKALREQLARVQHGLPPVAEAPPALGHSQSVPAVGNPTASDSTPAGAKTQARRGK